MRRASCATRRRISTRCTSLAGGGAFCSPLAPRSRRALAPLPPPRALTPRRSAVCCGVPRRRDPYSRLVPPRLAAVDDATAKLRAAVREQKALESEAKASVGIWSQYGIDEVRERFWRAYQDGKDFAKRMTFWDVLLGVGGRRDEELYVTMLRYLGQIMMNFTIGLISALVSFAISLAYMLWEYKVRGRAAHAAAHRAAHAAAHRAAPTAPRR